MLKASLIGAIIGFILMMSLSLLSPLCTLCFTPLLGIGVGYLTGWFETPSKLKISLIRGSLAGSLTGIGVVIGQMLAAVINGILVTHLEQFPMLIHELRQISQLVIADARDYWKFILVINTFFSAFNLVIIAGLGAVGGLIWFERQGKKLLAVSR